jgi:hypothetical protein
MDRWRRRLGFTVAALSLTLAAGCGRKSDDSPPAAVPARAEHAVAGDVLKEIRPVLKKLPDEQAQAAFQRWMSAHVSRGSADLAQVRALFGQAGKDLDRPPRDRILTLQFRLNDRAAAATFLLGVGPGLRFVDEEGSDAAPHARVVPRGLPIGRELWQALSHAKRQPEPGFARSQRAACGIISKQLQTGGRRLDKVG